MRAAALLASALPLAAAQKKCYVDLDLLFVLDGSLSIKSKSWATDLAATRTIANNFTFGCSHVENQQNAEMGIVQFSQQVRVEQHLTCDKDAFLSSVSSMEQLKGYTYTGDALEAASAEFAQNGRPTSTKAVVMITDGVPCTNLTQHTCYDKAPVPVPDPVQAAKAKQFASQMKDAGVVVITIAVGKFGTEGMAFIEDVSSAPADKYVFNPSTWSKLPALISEIVTSICPTPAPTPAPTQCSAALDMLFVLDASKSVGPKSWQIDLAAAGEIAGNFTFGCKDDPFVGGAQSEMGLVQFATNVTTPQPLTCDKDKFMAALQGLEEPCDIHNTSCKAFTYTGDAMAEAQIAFGESGRANSAKVLVLITDGVPCRSGYAPADEPAYPSWDEMCTDTSGSNCSCFRKLPDWGGDINTDPQPEPVQAAKAVAASAAMKDSGITVVGVAVGEFGSRGSAFMENVVSKPASKYLFNPHSWSKLPALVKTIVDSICPPPHVLP